MAPSGTYSGGWKRLTHNVPKVPLKPGPDPSHNAPDGHGAASAILGPQYWIQDTMVPAVPAEWVGDQYVQMPTIHGYVDETPIDHGHGTGIGHGETVDTAQEIRTAWHGEDLGATEVRRYQPATGRDGLWHVDIIPDNANDGASPAYVPMRYQQGVGIGSDPNARSARRILRWRERTIDMHRWDPEGRASRDRFAYSAPPQPVPTNGNQYLSAAPTLVRFGEAGVGTPDQFVTPIERRAPRPWDEGMTTDGVATTSVYGLTSWGL